MKSIRCLAGAAVMFAGALPPLQSAEPPNIVFLLADDLGWTKGLEHQHTTIAEALNTAGYRAACVGKWHLARRGHEEADAPEKHGFDVTYARPSGTRGYFLSKDEQEQTGRTYLTDYLTDKAIEFVQAANAASATASMMASPRICLSAVVKGLLTKVVFGYQQSCVGRARSSLAV